MMDAMVSRWSAALAWSSLLTVVVVACAQGTEAGDFEPGEVDAGDVEPAPTGKPKDGGVTEEEEEKPDPEDAGTKDSGPPVNTACLSALDAAKFDFEATAQGWTSKNSDGASGSWPYNPWSWGTATTITCPSGKCWGAERTQKYAQCQRGELVSPKINLSACSGEKITLTFTHAYAFWTGSYNAQTWFDGGIVEISMDDGSSWQVPTASYPGTVKINPDRGGSYECLLKNSFHVHNKSGFTQTQTTPQTFEITIPANYLNDKFRIRFSQASGVSSQTTDANSSRSATAAGWRIDDVKLVMK